MENNIKLEEVFEGELWQATMIKNILEDNGIQAVLQNELLGVIAPYLATAGGMNPVKVLVNAEAQDDAEKLVKEFNHSKPIDENSD